MLANIEKRILFPEERKAQTLLELTARFGDLTIQYGKLVAAGKLSLDKLAPEQRRRVEVLLDTLTEEERHLLA